MTVGLAFRICLYLLVTDGLAALALAGLLEPGWWPLVALGVGGSWWHEAVGRRVSAAVRHPHLVTLLLVGFFLFDLVYLAPSLLDAFVHLLLLALFYKLYTRRTLRDSRDVLLLSFFALVASAALTVSVGFLLILVVFLVLGTWTFMLHHMLCEAERHAGVRAPALAGSRDLLTPSLLGLAATASVIGVGFTLLFFFVIPRVGQAALPIQSRLAPMVSGFSDRVELGAFGAIQESPAVVMRVRFPDGLASPEALPGLRWRGVAFDHFTGREWRATEAERRMLLPVAGGYLLARPRGRGPVVTQEIFLEPLATEVLFAAPRLLAVAVAGPVWVDPLGAVSSPAREARLHYRALSELETPVWRAAAGEADLPARERARYLQLPPLSPRIHAFAREVTRQSPDRAAAALRLTEYLRSHLRYSLELKRTPGADPVEDFLFVTRSGNCEYFAASLAVLLRSLGIPARVVNGFQRGEWNPYGGYFTVRQRDAHSWVEAHLAGLGWVTLDASPRAEADAAWAPSATFQYLDALRMRWHRYIVNWSLGDQLRASWAVRERALHWRRMLREARPALPGSPRGLLLAAALAAGLGAAVLLWRRGLPRPWVPARRPASCAAYDRMLRRLARLGLVPAPGETAREFGRRAALELPSGGGAIKELTRAYEAARFGGAAIAPGDLGRLRRLADGLAAARPGRLPLSRLPRR